MPLFAAVHGGKPWDMEMHAVCSRLGVQVVDTLHRVGQGKQAGKVRHAGKL